MTSDVMNNVKICDSAFYPKNEDLNIYSVKNKSMIIKLHYTCDLEFKTTT